MKFIKTNHRKIAQEILSEPMNSSVQLPYGAYKLYVVMGPTCLQVITVHINIKF